MKYRILILLLGLIALYAPHFLAPINELDSGWYCDHAYTIWRGRPFWSDSIDAPIPYFYGFLIAPFALLVNGIYLSNVFYATVSVILGSYILYKRNFDIISLLLALIILFDHSIHLHRPEIVVLLLCLLAEPWMFRNGEPRYLPILLFSLFILLIHPSAGLLGLGGIIIFHQPKILFSKITVAILIISLFFLLVYLFLFPDLGYSRTLINRVAEGKQLEHFAKYLMYSGITLVGLIWTCRKIGSTRFIILFTLLAVFTAIISGYYYFSLLLTPLILYMLYNKIERTAIPILSFILVFNTLVSVAHPIVTYIENPEYAYQIKRINTILKSREYIRNVYSEHSFGGTLFDHLPNTRSLIYQKNTFLGIRTRPVTGDVFYAYSRMKLNLLEDYLTIKRIKYETTQKSAPVKGNLQLSKFYTSRTDSLALWELTVL